jgi:5-methylcytosine-specific restriction protein B
MKSYIELQEIVYNWLMNKHSQDSLFTFSVRQVASKGAELNYFIGTEKSEYFSTTFWSIQVNYPGSSSDLINLVFELNGDSYSYHIHFNQTRSPFNDQNRFALEFIKQIKERVRDFRGFYENDPANKIEYFHVGDAKAKYFTESELFTEVEKDMSKLLPIVDEELIRFKTENPEFKAEKISENHFDLMISRLEKRRAKHAPLLLSSTQSEEVKVETPIFVKIPTKTNQPLNQILYGPPGTGKTYNTINKALELIGENILGKSRESIKELFNAKVQEGQIVFTTFHQSMSYEDFIEGIKPETVDNEVIYEIKPGVFKQLCEQAKAKAIASDNFEQVYKKFLDEIKKNQGKLILESIVHSKEFTVYVNSKNNLRFHANTEKRYEGVIKKEVVEHYLKTGETLDWPSYVKAVGLYLVSNYNYSKKEQVEDKKYVLIIDEINRGNVSQIFGELITLIEDDKRLGNDEALEVTLPYSKKKFGVPSNLYIIGTMNTADRSVEALDAALRRRFSFEEMPPKPGLIETDGKTSDGFIDEINLVELLQTINKRLEILLDKDHQIGHSYFLCVANLDELKKAFQNKIIPLLQEYFFGDYGKIGLVLGNGFVTVSNFKQEKLFADFNKEYDATEFAEKLIYRIENVALMDNDTFNLAIKSLIND